MTTSYFTTHCSIIFARIAALTSSEQELVTGLIYVQDTTGASAFSSQLQHISS